MQLVQKREKKKETSNIFINFIQKESDVQYYIICIGDAAVETK